MDDVRSGEPALTKNRTAVERRSERELVVTRIFDAPARLVYEAWTTPGLMMQWWMPKSCGASFISCEIDARTGGSYKFVFGHPANGEQMTFFGRYIEAVPGSRLVWTNEEGGENGPVTTVTFEERNGATVVVMHDLHPTKESLDEAVASGSTSGFAESFEQLDGVLAACGRA